MDPKFEAFHERIRSTGLQHCDRIGELPQIPREAHSRTRDTWQRHSFYAAEIVNDCLAKNLRWGSGFQYDEPSGSTFLITATTLPFVDLRQTLLHKFASDTVFGIAYTGLLRNLLDDPQIGQLRFGDFHHWLFSVGSHGVWVNCCLGRRNPSTHGLTFLLPADAVFSPNEFAIYLEAPLLEW